jgi:hypothetical protein
MAGHGDRRSHDHRQGPEEARFNARHGDRGIWWMALRWETLDVGIGLRQDMRGKGYGREASHAAHRLAVRGHPPRTAQQPLPGLAEYLVEGRCKDVDVISPENHRGF